jgi:Uma2 family endonuclease
MTIQSVSPPSNAPLTVADLFPAPGEWTEADYFPVSERSRIIELSNGNLEIAPMPTDLHQLILGRLFAALFALVSERKLGQVRFSPLPVRLWPGKIREPDLIFMSAAHADRIQKYWGVPDLAVEIISEGTEKTDREIKRVEYAQARIPEYWIIDPEAQIVEVLRLQGRTYSTEAQLGNGDTLISPTFPGFELPLADLFAAE